MNMVHKKILEKKQEIRALAKSQNINEYNNNNYCDIINTKPENYSSDVFSKLQYDDLKHAHTETVIPVTEDDLRQQYNNLEEFIILASNLISIVSYISANKENIETPFQRLFK